MTKWLHRHHFGYKKPTGVPHKFDEVKQHPFIEAYHELKVSGTKHESILFMDTVHPTPAAKSNLWREEERTRQAFGNDRQSNTSEHHWCAECKQHIIDLGEPI